MSDEEVDAPNTEVINMFNEVDTTFPADDTQRKASSSTANCHSGGEKA